MVRRLLLVLIASCCAGCPSASTVPPAEAMQDDAGGSVTSAAPVDIIAPIEIGGASGGAASGDDPLLDLFDDDVRPPLLVNPATADPFTLALLHPELAGEIFDAWLDAGLVDLGGGLSGSDLNGSFTYLERLCIAQGQPEFICRGLYGR